MTCTPQVEMNSKQVGRWMDDEYIGRVRWLAFDVFGTVVDLAGSLSGPVGEFLGAQGSGDAGGQG